MDSKETVKENFEGLYKDSCNTINDLKCQNAMLKEQISTLTDNNHDLKNKIEIGREQCVQLLAKVEAYEFVFKHLHGIN